jgi:NAD(P)H dehydrogenase (quinone)
MILVTGATGRVGYHLMAALADAGAEATAMVRVEAKGQDLPGPGPHIVAAFDEPPAAEVLQAFDRVFLLSPASEEQAELEILFIDALVAAGHRPYVVKVAADGFQEPGCEVRFMRSHRQIAAHLEATGLPASYLAPSLYMENLLSTADTLRTEGTIYAPAGHGRVGFIAAGDVAKVAARLLAGPGRDARTYVLSGPEALRYRDVAERISAVFAREVDYADLPSERAREQLLASGRTPWEVEGTLELFDWVRSGAAATVSADVRAVTGRDGRPIQEWLDDFRGAFLNPPPDLPSAVF